MSGDHRIERRLPEILADLGAGPHPDYTDLILARTAATRQRPGRLFPERWFPVSAISRRIAVAPPVPWRLVAVLVMLILALAAAAIYAGSQQRRLPLPFGPASNGVIPFADGGDIYVGDPVTGTTHLLVGGSSADSGPQFSLDGTKVQFVRDIGGGRLDIYVVQTDGGGVTKITPQPIANLLWVSWMPDGQRFAVISAVDGVTNRLDLYDAAGKGRLRTLLTAQGVDSVQARPPDGQELLYRALVADKWGLFAVDAESGTVRTIDAPEVPSTFGLAYGTAVYSPTGNRIFYNHASTDPTTDYGCCTLWVMNADGTDDHEFIPPPGPFGQTWRGLPDVSPDGSRIAYWHSHSDQSTQRLTIARADGGSSLIETGPDLAGSARWVWAPDSSKILLYPDDGSSTHAYLVDPDGGPWTTLPWASDGDLGWQRVAGDR